MGLLSSIGKGIVKVLDINKAAFTNPVTLVTKGVDAAVKQSNSYTPAQAVPKILATTATVAGAVLTAGTSLGRTAAVTVAKTLVPKTAKGVIATAVAAPVVVGVLSSSSKAREGLISAPSSLANVGSNIGKVIENPTIENVKETFKENPVAATLIAAAPLAIVGGGISGTVASIANTAAVKENTKASTPSAPAISPDTVTVVDKSSQFKAMPVPTETVAASTSPTTAQTHAVSTKSSTKRKKKAVKAAIPSISQKVNVIVQNRSSSVGMKNYLKREVLLN